MPEITGHTADGFQVRKKEQAVCGLLYLEISKGLLLIVQNRLLEQKLFLVCFHQPFHGFPGHHHRGRHIICAFLGSNLPEEPVNRAEQLLL